MHWQHEWIAALYGWSGTLPEGMAGSQPAKRFEVYRSSLVANLSSALRDTYPVVNRLLGAECFDQIARGYLSDHPSMSGDIHAFGADFAAYLVSLEQTAHLNYLPDVARLEWLAHECFHATASTPMDLDALSALPVENCSELRLQPSVRLMHSAFPVHRIWQVNQPDWSDEPTVDLSEGVVHLAVSREGQEIVLRPLSPAAFTFGRALEQGTGLDAACEIMLTAYPESDAGHALHELLTDDLIAAYTSPLVQH